MNKSSIKIDKFLKNFDINQFQIIFIRREFIVILSILTINFKYFIFLTKKSHFFKFAYNLNFRNCCKTLRT